MGDANLCAKKWNDDNFTHKIMANLLQGQLESCGIKIGNVGPTFMADHCQKNGSIAESWLDHIYYSEKLESIISIKTINNHSSDHLPVVASLTTKLTRKIYNRKIIKRKMKNFTNEGWNESLEKQNWSRINETKDLNKKVEIFNELVTLSLDDIAPFSTFTVRTNHKFGLSDEVKCLMEKRENARKMIKQVNNDQKAIWNAKYKKLRNAVNSKIRKQETDHNNNRIDAAKDENEVWKVAKEIISPTQEKVTSMKIDNKVTDDPEIIADAFNKFFINKIADLKEKIDPNLVSDPLSKLKEVMKNNKKSFSLKTISISDLKQTIKNLKPKKSSGLDGLTQQQLKTGANILVAPLQNIFNQSITIGEFPTIWKEAVVTPVHKKGDKMLLENYRPVSCLPAAAKLLELVACTQTSEYMEKNNLLPTSQHGFRQKRSTITCFWVLNTPICW